MKNKAIPAGLEAVILDMDGVITQTAITHKEAWEKMFNDFLRKHSKSYSPFTDKDYGEYVDGKPRYKGVQSFLESRNISIPYGDPNDKPGKESICGLGNRKNELLLEILKDKGVKVYKHAIDKITYWRDQGLKTAVDTSSKNCKYVLEAAGISDLFDVRIDGIVSQERGLKGKPEPDIFLEATKELGISPLNSIVFEDAISGVQAGAKGNFAFVVGVSRTGNERDLYHNGADIVIRDFSEIKIFNNPETEPYFTPKVPFLFNELDEFRKMIQNKEPVLFFDYDGTLTPIVKRPEDALISDEMKHALQQVASRFTVAVVSGRDMDDVKSKIGLESIVYAGSHGFRISGPNGLYKEHEKSEEILPQLDCIERLLESGFSKGFEGVRVDRKRYAVAVHYRNAKEEDLPALNRLVEELLQDIPGFKKGEGKKIIEIKPDVDWHKGKAINWILERLNMTNTDKYFPVYIGDDITDEDAFKALMDKGLGILVGFHGQATAAKYALKNVYQVRLLLEMIAGRV
jgi:trehalose 6-phosphate phosphatase